MNIRNPWLDCARGIAVIAMVIYHFTWDLSFFGFIETDINTAPFWRGLARAIAGSFLFLSGISLYLAHGNNIRWSAFLRRLAILAGAAAFVTLVTWYQFPDSYIFFGILHCLALSSLIGLMFLKVHWLVTILGSISTFALPYMFTATFFDTPVLAFLGLRTLPIRTNDFVPILPWISPMLVGIAVVQISQNLSLKTVFIAPKLSITPLQFLGRHSLIIYLIHQPILFQATGFISSFKTKKVDEITSSFVSACEQSCTAQGRDKQTCIETCFCTVDGLKATGIWAKISTSVPDEATRLEIAKMAKTCQR
jgi:uncharacterized membrane protein